MAYIGAEPVPGQNREVDDISSSFNGSTTAFTLQVSGVNVSPESANNILVNLGGVLQNPGTDYTIAASTITFTTAPASGLSFFALVLGAGINTATVADDTIGASKLIDTAVTAGSYTTADITVDAQGRITAAANGTIATAEIADGAVNNAKVNASAAIAGTKISPDFGSQAISTTNDSVTIGDSIIHSGDTNTKIRFPAADTISFETGGSEVLRIDSSGRLLFGLTSSISGVGIQLRTAFAQIYKSGNDASAGFLDILKTRNSDAGSNTVLQSGDVIGSLRFRGSASDGYVNGAFIRAVVNGTPGSGNDLPTDLQFHTMPDGVGSTDERLRITSNGAVHIKSAGTSYNDFTGDSDAGLVIGSSSNSNSGVMIRTGTSGTGRLNFGDGDGSSSDRSRGFIHYSHSNNALTFGSDASEAMRLVNSGDLVCHGTGLNNSSVSGQALQVQGTTRPTLILRGNASGSNQCEIQFADNSGSDSDPGTRVGMIQYDHSTNNFRVQVNEVTRFKIPSKGGIHCEFNDGDSLGYRFKRVQGSNNHNLLATTHSSGGIDGGGTESFVVQTDGDVQNINNSYGQISDIKYKENIVDATSQWEDIKAIKVRNFNFKEETNFGTHTQIGVVAQELETVSPKLINTKTDFDEDGTDLGTKTKVVKYSVLYMKAIKALQEAQTRIETLETKVAALEAA